MEIGHAVERIVTGRHYLEALQRMADGDWRDLYRAFKSGDLPLVDSISLAHPSHYEA